MTKAQKLYDSIPDNLENTDLLGDTPEGETTVIPVYLQKPKNKNYNVKWGIFWQEESEDTGMSMLEMAANKDLNLTDMRVRDYMFCKCGIGNFVHISQTEASQYLKIPRPHVSVSIRKLIDMGILLEGPSAGKFKTYQVNPAIMYAGSMNQGVKERKAAINDAKERAKAIPFKQQDNAGNA